MSLKHHKLIENIKKFSESFKDLHYITPHIGWVYNPLIYAWASHSDYLEKYASKKKLDALFLGINPGPWGMAQTGVPFGDVEMVKNWLGIHNHVFTPEGCAPNRPVLGFENKRREISGHRFWNFAKNQCGKPEDFFERFFVWNYCPLLFLDTPNAKNRTPDKLYKADRTLLFERCDPVLHMLVDYFEPQTIVGIGKFTAARASEALGNSAPEVISILHPSPANPKANRGWEMAITTQLKDAGIL